MALKFPRTRTLCIVLAGLALAVVSAEHAIAMSTRVLNPTVALRIDSDEPVALAREAALQLGVLQQAKKAIPRSLGEQARRSLTGLALNPAALRVLAIATQPSGAQAADPRLVALSDRISRRDLGTQVLRIKEGAVRKDITIVRDAYDKALTANEESWQLMFPPLAELMKSSEGREQFAYFIARGAPWLSPFFRTTLDTTKTPEPYFDLLIARRGLSNLSGSRAIQDVLINSLVANGDWSMARLAFLYRGYGPPAALTSADLNKTTLGDGKSTLYWFFPRNPGLAAVPIGGRFLSVSAEPGYSGTVAQKILYLAPRRYDLATTLAEPGDSEPADLAWSVQCLSDETKDHIDLPVERSASATRLMHTFTVPTTCNAVMLVLTAGAKPSARLGGSAAVQEIALRPRS